MGCKNIKLVRTKGREFFEWDYIEEVCCPYCEAKNYKIKYNIQPQTVSFDIEFDGKLISGDLVDKAVDSVRLSYDRWYSCEECGENFNECKFIRMDK